MQHISHTSPPWPAWHPPVAVTTAGSFPQRRWSDWLIQSAGGSGTPCPASVTSATAWLLTAGGERRVRHLLTGSVF